MDFSEVKKSQEPVSSEQVANLGSIKETKIIKPIVRASSVDDVSDIKKVEISSSSTFEGISDSYSKNAVGPKEPFLPEPFSHGGVSSIRKDMSIIAVLAAVLEKQARTDAQAWRSSFEMATESMIMQLELAPAIAESVKANWNSQARATQAQSDMAFSGGMSNLISFGATLALGGLSAYKANKSPTPSVQIKDEAAAKATATSTSTLGKEATKEATSLKDKIKNKLGFGSKAADKVDDVAGSSASSRKRGADAKDADDAVEGKRSRSGSASSVSRTRRDTGASQGKTSAVDASDDITDAASKQAKRQSDSAAKEVRAADKLDKDNKATIDSKQAKAAEFSEEHIQEQANQVTGFTDRVKKAWGGISPKMGRATTLMNTWLTSSVQSSVLVNMSAEGMNKLLNESPQMAKVAAAQKDAGIAEAETKTLEALSNYNAQNFQRQESFREGFAQGIQQAMELIRSAGAAQTQTASALFR